MRLLELFCGRGGWSKAFAAKGWQCVGVDLTFLGYPFEFVQADVRELNPAWIDEFDAVIASPPCEDFARAWLPWLRGDRKPKKEAIELLTWSVSLCDRPRRLVECSRFASWHVAGAVYNGSYALWGDVPLLMSEAPRIKTSRSGLRPDVRAEIPTGLADDAERWFAGRVMEGLLCS